MDKICSSKCLSTVLGFRGTLSKTLLVMVATVLQVWFSKVLPWTLFRRQYVEL